MLLLSALVLKISSFDSKTCKQVFEATISDMSMILELGECFEKRKDYSLIFYHVPNMARYLLSTN